MNSGTMDGECSTSEPIGKQPAMVAPGWLRQLVLDVGADDVGFVSVDREEIAAEAPHILEAFPQTRTLVSIVCRLNPDNVRSPARSIGNLEFHRNYHHINVVAAEVVRKLAKRGIRAVNPSAGFPMEMDQWPGRIWVVSHKPVAVAAGLGKIGIHRSVIHPKFGALINLATVLVAANISSENKPLDFNPCVRCRLCVTACPVGAIAPDGHFDFSACYTHNYREFMGGFADWAEAIADAGSAKALRARLSDAEQASMWQSLSFGANYKAAYCIAVCPAGEDAIAPFRENRTDYVKRVVEPLQKKEEPLYVIPGSDAEAFAGKRYPHKALRRVGSALRPRTIEGFLGGLPHVFQRGKSKGLSAVYHFTFTGGGVRKATISIKDRKLAVAEGHVGQCDIAVTADAKAWLAFVYKERSLVSMLLTRNLRIKGSPRLLLAFGHCFPN